MSISLTHVYKSYDDDNVFTNLNISFPHNETTVIMGASGCGKTTLINMLAGLTDYDHGEISGIDFERLSMVFQEDRLIEHLNGIDNLLITMRNTRENTPRAMDLLNRAGLGEDAKKIAREYSGGMKRRLALCRALMIEFDFLILDEPFKGLDEDIKPRIMELIREQTAGKTVLIVTHDPTEARFFRCPIIRLDV
ncbi:MAG: ATP-binding cassette domain-containing protein [Defluviitaleaceae bacterium]|nr:ATP-binding cassette domain-containing protein [Defluviitaleaceae bacterium]